MVLDRAGLKPIGQLLSTEPRAGFKYTQHTAAFGPAPPKPDPAP
jgi:hypothetical protein